MQRNFLIITCLAIVLIFSGINVESEIIAEPNEFHVKIYPDQNKTFEIMFLNTGNTTISGQVAIVTIRWTSEHPHAYLAIHDIQLEPGESINTTLTVYSYPGTTQDVSYPIYYRQNNSENDTEIGTVYITIQTDYWPAILIWTIVIIAVIVIMLALKKFRKKTKPNPPPQTNLNDDRRP